MINYSFQIQDRVHKARKKLLAENGVGKITIGRYPTVNGRVAIYPATLGVFDPLPTVGCDSTSCWYSEYIIYSDEAGLQTFTGVCIPEHQCAIL
jgi:hypothetical protein